MKRRTKQRTKRKPKRKEEAAASAVGFVRGFHPPSEEECVAAAAGIAAADTTFEADAGFFDPLQKPTHELDWLAQFKETPQSYRDWLRSYRRRPRTGHDTLCLLPFGNDIDGNLLRSLRSFAEVFFNGVFARVELLPRTALAIDVPFRNCHRYHAGEYKSSHVQVCIDEFVPLLERAQRSAGNHFATIGVTFTDVHMDHTDEFAVGAAGLGSGIALFSFARYDPGFSARARTPDWIERHKDDPTVIPTVADPVEARRVLLGRCCKVLAHELLHVLGFGHCVYYSCLMNGSGHVVEDDRQPLRLCPVDLHKFASLATETSGSFDAVAWLSGLAAFFDSESILPTESAWIQRRIAFINAKQHK